MPGVNFTLLQQIEREERERQAQPDHNRDLVVRHDVRSSSSDVVRADADRWKRANHLSRPMREGDPEQPPMTDRKQALILQAGRLMHDGGFDNDSDRATFDRLLNEAESL